MIIKILVVNFVKYILKKKIYEKLKFLIVILGNK